MNHPAVVCCISSYLCVEMSVENQYAWLGVEVQTFENVLI